MVRQRCGRSGIHHGIHCARLRPLRGAFAQRVLRAVDKLSTLPRLGRVVPEYKREDIRELIFQNHRIIYKLEPERVAIAAIVHAGRDLMRWYPPEA